MTVGSDGSHAGRIIWGSETDLESDLIAIDLSVLDVTPHLHNLEPVEIEAQCSRDALPIALPIAFEMLCSDVPTTSTSL